VVEHLWWHADGDGGAVRVRGRGGCSCAGRGVGGGGEGGGGAAVRAAARVAVVVRAVVWAAVRAYLARKKVVDTKLAEVERPPRLLARLRDCVFADL
jgi:hypothetical protein